MFKMKNKKRRGFGNESTRAPSPPNKSELLRTYLLLGCESVMSFSTEFGPIKNLKERTRSKSKTNYKVRKKSTCSVQMMLDQNHTTKLKGHSNKRLSASEVKSNSKSRPVKRATSEDWNRLLTEMLIKSSEQIVARSSERLARRSRSRKPRSRRSINHSKRRIGEDTAQKKDERDIAKNKKDEKDTNKKNERDNDKKKDDRRSHPTQPTGKHEAQPVTKHETKTRDEAVETKTQREAKGVSMQTETDTSQGFVTPPMTCEESNNSTLNEPSRGIREYGFNRTALDIQKEGYSRMAQDIQKEGFSRTVQDIQKEHPSYFRTEHLNDNRERLQIGNSSQTIRHAKDSYVSYASSSYPTRKKSSHHEMQNYQSKKNPSHHDTHHRSKSTKAKTVISLDRLIALDDPDLEENSYKKKQEFERIAEKLKSKWHQSIPYTLQKERYDNYRREAGTSESRDHIGNALDYIREKDTFGARSSRISVKGKRYADKYRDPTVKILSDLRSLQDEFEDVRRALSEANEEEGSLSPYQDNGSQSVHGGQTLKNPQYFEQQSKYHPMQTTPTTSYGTPPTSYTFNHLQGYNGQNQQNNFDTQSSQESQRVEQKPNRSEDKGPIQYTQPPYERLPQEKRLHSSKKSHHEEELHSYTSEPSNISQNVQTQQTSTPGRDEREPVPTKLHNSNDSEQSTSQGVQMPPMHVIPIPPNLAPNAQNPYVNQKEYEISSWPYYLQVPSDAQPYPLPPPNQQIPQAVHIPQYAINRDGYPPNAILLADPSQIPAQYAPHLRKDLFYLTPRLPVTPKAFPFKLPTQNTYVVQAEQRSEVDPRHGSAWESSSQTSGSSGQDDRTICNEDKSPQIEYLLDNVKHIGQQYYEMSSKTMVPVLRQVQNQLICRFYNLRQYLNQSLQRYVETYESSHQSSKDSEVSFVPDSRSMDSRAGRSPGSRHANPSEGSRKSRRNRTPESNNKSERSHESKRHRTPVQMLQANQPGNLNGKENRPPVPIHPNQGVRSRNSRSSRSPIQVHPHEAMKSRDSRTNGLPVHLLLPDQAVRSSDGRDRPPVQLVYPNGPMKSQDSKGGTLPQTGSCPCKNMCNLCHCNMCRYNQCHCYVCHCTCCCHVPRQ